MRTLVIKESETCNSYDVYERFSLGGSETDKLTFIGFLKEDYNFNDIKKWIRTYSPRYSSRNCKIIIETSNFAK